MEKYFDDVHAGWDSQLTEKACMLDETAEIAELREAAHEAEGFLTLGDALSRQLRYREAIEAYTKAIEAMPDNLRACRSRAARYLATLQMEKAEADFHRCRDISGDQIDISYRLGICRYLLGDYEESISIFEHTYPLCDDELGIAVLYWHTLSSCRNGTEPSFLCKWHEGMKVGHHTAYQKAVRVFGGSVTVETMLEELSHEPEDLEYSISLYGISIWLRRNGEEDKYVKQMKCLLRRDGFWPSFAYLAAWNDCYRI